MKEHYTPFCLQVEIIWLILNNHTALFSDPKDAQPTSVLYFWDFSPTSSVVLIKDLHQSQELPMPKGEAERPKRPNMQLPGATPVHTLEQRTGYTGLWGVLGLFFCPPHYSLTGLLCASPTVQGIGGFAMLRGRSWEEAGEKWSWHEGSKEGQSGWEIKKDVDNFFS